MGIDQTRTYLFLLKLAILIILIVSLPYKFGIPRFYIIQYGVSLDNKLT